MFLLNSRLGLFSAAHSLHCERPLFRSYRTILPSSLTANHSSALVYSTQPPVSVYGTGNHAICLADFLGSTVTVVHISLCKHSEYCQVRISERICLLRSTPTPFNHLFRQVAGPSHLRLHIAHIISTGILTGSSIGSALRLPLRPRLTLIRLALIRNP